MNEKEPTSNKLPEQDRAEKIAQEYSSGLVSTSDLGKAVGDFVCAMALECSRAAALSSDPDSLKPELSREKLVGGANASGKKILSHIAERLLLPDREPLDEIYDVGCIVTDLEEVLSPSEFERAFALKLLGNDAFQLRDVDPRMISEEARELRELIIREASGILKKQL